MQPKSSLIRHKANEALPCFLRIRLFCHNINRLTRVTPRQFICPRSNHHYKIEKTLGDGGAGYVYLATRNNQQYALKIVREDIEDSEKLREIYEYVRKLLMDTTGRDYNGLSFSALADLAERYAMEKVKKHNIKYARIIEYGENYTVKEYLGEINGDVALKTIKSDNLEHPMIIKLQELINSLVSRGLAPLDFKPKNCMWHNGDWYIVDILALLETNEPEKASEIIKDQFIKKWMPILNKNLGESLKTQLFGSCRNLVREFTNTKNNRLNARTTR